MCAHEQVYKNSDYPDNIEKAAKAFHKNELNLLFSSKWGFKLKHQYFSKNYSSQFFNYIFRIRLISKTLYLSIQNLSRDLTQYQPKNNIKNHLHICLNPRHI